MALNFSYLYMEDSKGVQFKGFTGESVECQEPFGGSNYNMIKVYSVSHSIHMPTSSHDKRAVGAPMHSPLVFTCERDLSYPRLAQAMNQGVHVQGACHFMSIARQQKSGDLETDSVHHNAFSLVFKDALISGLSYHKPMSGGETGDLIDISIVYREISWRDHDDKVYTAFFWDSRHRADNKH